jgi:hypothetical protein
MILTNLITIQVLRLFFQFGYHDSFLNSKFKIIITINKSDRLKNSCCLLHPHNLILFKCASKSLNSKFFSITFTKLLVERQPIKRSLGQFLLSNTNFFKWFYCNLHIFKFIKILVPKKQKNLNL